MARIRPYESQVGSQAETPGRGASVQDFGGPGLINLGNAVQSAGQDASQVQRIVQDNASRQAVSDVHTFLTEAHAVYTKKAKEFETKADPSDPNLWDKFAYGGDPDAPVEGTLKYELDAYKANIQDANALRAFDQGAARLTAQFSDHFVGVQSKMAGIYAKQQATKMVDAAQVSLQTDPSQYEAVLAATLAAVDDPASSFGRLSAEQREPIKRQITEQLTSSAVHGLIREDPKLALHQLENGTWDTLGLKGEDKLTLLRAADSAIRAEEVRVRQEEQRQKQLRQQAADAISGTFLTQMAAHFKDPKQPMPNLLSEQGRDLAKLDDDKYKGLLSMAHAWANDHDKTPKTNYTTYWDLYERIHLPYGDPRKITSLAPIIEAAGKRHQLSPTDTERLTKQFTESQTEDGSKVGPRATTFLNSVKSSITKSNPLAGKLDQEGDVKFGEFTQFVQDEIERARKENRSPHDIFRKESPHFVGNDLARFQTTMQESMKNIQKKLQKAPGIPKAPSGGVPDGKKRLPGETPEQFDERMERLFGGPKS